MQRYRRRAAELLSGDHTADREFAAMPRRGDKMLSVVELGAESPLLGSSVAALDLTVIAIEDEAGTVETLPAAGRAIRAGDRLPAIGRPGAPRKLKASPGATVRDPLEAEAGGPGEAAAG